MDLTVSSVLARGQTADSTGQLVVALLTAWDGSNAASATSSSGIAPETVSFGKEVSKVSSIDSFSGTTVEGILILLAMVSTESDT